MSTLRPFRAHVSDADLTDLAERLGTIAAQAPQRLAHALDDSPVGLLAFAAQAMPDLDADARVAAVALLWLTGTAGSALRIYQAAAAEPPAAPTPVPVAVAQFPGDLGSVRAFAEHVHPDLRVVDRARPRWSQRGAPGARPSRRRPAALRRGAGPVDVLAGVVLRPFPDTTAAALGPRTTVSTSVIPRPRRAPSARRVVVRPPLRRADAGWARRPTTGWRCGPTR